MKRFTCFILVSVSLLLYACSGDGCSPPKSHHLAYFEVNIANEPYSLAEDREEDIIISLTPYIEPSQQQTSLLRFSLFKHAMATSCPSDNLFERISYINVSSTSDFDELHPAGESLNDLLLKRYSNTSTLETIIGLELYVGIYDFWFSSYPTLNQIHQFEIEIIMDNGDQYFLQTEEVVFPG